MNDNDGESRSNLEKALGMDSEGVMDDMTITYEPPTTLDDRERINHDMDDLYRKTMKVFDTQITELDTIDPKYVPRFMEVSKQYLDNAVEILKLRQRQVEHSDKMVIDALKLSTDEIKKSETIDGITTIDRNELLKKIQSK